MKTAVISAAVSAVVSATVTIVAVQVAVPPMVSAQGADVRAERFILVGSDGSNRAVLRELTSPTGTPGASLALLQEGQVRAQVAYGGRGPEGAAVNLGDMDGRRRINLAVATGLETGTLGDLTRIAVLDRRGKARLAMGVDRDGSPFIVLLDGAGSPTWSVGAPVENVLRAGR